LVVGRFDGLNEVDPNPNPNTGEEDGNFECRTVGTRSEGDVLGFADTDGVELGAATTVGTRSEGDVLGFADTDGVELVEGADGNTGNEIL